MRVSGSPDGWLWTRMTPAALSRTASRKSSPTRTSDDADVALVDRRHAEDVVLRVEQHDPQLLALEAAHLEDEPVGHVVRAADRPARRRPVRQQPAAELERRHELGGACRPDPAHRGELQLRGTRQAGQPVVTGQRVGGEVHGRAPARPGAPDQPDEFGGRQACRPRASASRSRGRSAIGSSRIARPPPGGSEDGSSDPVTAAPPFDLG